MSHAKPMQRSLLIACAAFISLLCLVLSVQSYLVFSRSLYARYDSKLYDVLLYIRHHIDVDDLAECIDTGVTSEKYDELQLFLNSVIDDFQLFYLYIVYPDTTSDTTMYNVVSATSAAEIAAGDVEEWPLYYVVEYPPEALAR